MSRVLVTGANGFIGSALCPRLTEAGYVVRAALHRDAPIAPSVAEHVSVGEIRADTDWGAALNGVELVVHLAARVHVLHDGPDAERLCLETNAYGTRRLAQEALRYGVRRLVYLSSVKVNGEENVQRAFSADDTPRPQDAYARSKWRGEQSLAEVAGAGELEAVVVRSPLVYGPGVRANFMRLLHWVDRARPLPFGAIRNQRSLVSVWSLCDLLIRVLDHRAAVGRTWMISDGEDVSTPELVRRIARAMNRPVRLLPVPLALLRLAGGLLGQRPELHRLCGSLTVNIAPTRQALGWSPLLPLDEALARTVAWYRSTAASG